MKLSPDQVRKIAEVRCELEALAVRNAIYNLTDDHLLKMKILLDKMENASVEQFLQFNMEFHDSIYQLCDNEFLRDMIKQLRNNVERYLNIYLKDDSHFHTAHEEHYSIYYALVQRDGVLAEEMTRKHLKGTCESIAQHLEKSLSQQ
jgi:DNA-binding GntR family transcriptional regulator